MYVVKRDGRQETVHFNKITARLKKLCYGLNSYHCDPVLVAQKVCAGVYKGVTTSKLDELAAETAAAMTASHSDYACLASGIAVLNLHKNTKKSFSETQVLSIYHTCCVLSSRSSLNLFRENSKLMSLLKLSNVLSFSGK